MGRLATKTRPDGFLLSGLGFSLTQSEASTLIVSLQTDPSLAGQVGPVISETDSGPEKSSSVKGEDARLHVLRLERD